MTLLNELNVAVEQEILTSGVDHSQEQKGGNLERVVFPKGKYPACLTGYVDLGKQWFDGFEGAKGSYSDAVMLEFKVYNFTDRDENGNPRYIYLNTGTKFPMKLSLNNKSTFFKWFTEMAKGGTGNEKHMAQFIGSKAFSVEVTVNKNGKYNNLNMKMPPIPLMEGSVMEGQRRAILPELQDNEIKLLLWNNPTMGQWDSLQIGDAERSPADPKNFIKAKILEASNFAGSSLDLLLREGGVDTSKPVETFTEDPEQEFDELPEEMDVPVKTPEKTVPSGMPVMPEGV